MKLKLYTEPSIEPITLAEAKEFLRLSTETFAGDIENVVSIAPGSHAVGTLNGASVEVLGMEAVVILNAGTCTGTLDVTIQDSDDGSVWTDVDSYDQVTSANDDAVYEKSYDGTKRYVRGKAVVGTDVCEFAISVIRKSATIAEETTLTDMIQAARENIEDYLGRAILTQTWEMYLDEFPDDDYIVLPFGNLQSVDLFQYVDSDDNTTILTEDTDYLVERNGDGYGRIVLPYDIVWPTATLNTSNPITIRFTCGWSSTDDVPEAIKNAMKMLLADMYENRETQQFTALPGAKYIENTTYAKLLAGRRLRWQF